MSICTFFGHGDCPETIQPVLLTTLHTLIEAQGVNTFYVGNQGRFDVYVTHSWGGASQFVEKAKRQNKTVIALSDGSHPA